MLDKSNCNSHYAHFVSRACKPITQYEQIIAEAKLWLGTKFFKQGRKRNVGCDCLGLLIAVARSANSRSTTYPKQFVHAFDCTDYDIAKDSHKMVHFLNTHALRKSIPKPGHALLLRVGWRHWHLGIISSIEYDDTKNSEDDKFAMHSAESSQNYAVRHQPQDQWQDQLPKKIREINIIHACMVAGKVIEQRIDHRFISTLNNNLRGSSSIAPANTFSVQSGGLINKMCLEQDQALPTTSLQRVAQKPTHHLDKLPPLSLHSRKLLTKYHHTDQTPCGNVLIYELYK